MNVYNHHLATCLNRPTIIDGDKNLNEKIDEILKRHKELKAEKKKEFLAFNCPYCNKQYTTENLRHLLGCALANPADKEKLRAYFEDN